MNSRKDLNLGEVVYISIIFHIQASWLNLLNGHDYIFDGVTLQASHMRQLVYLRERKAPKNKQGKTETPVTFCDGFVSLSFF